MFDTYNLGENIETFVNAACSITGVSVAKLHKSNNYGNIKQLHI